MNGFPRAEGSQLHAPPVPQRVGAFCLKRDVLGKLCQDTCYVVLQCVPESDQRFGAGALC